MSEQLPERLRPKDIAERLTGLGYRARGIISDPQWEAITEAIRRLRQHEVLVEEVLPELRAKAGTGANRPDCCG